MFVVRAFDLFIALRGGAAIGYTDRNVDSDNHWQLESSFNLTAGLLTVGRTCCLVSYKEHLCSASHDNIYIHIYIHVCFDNKVYNRLKIITELGNIT